MCRKNYARRFATVYDAGISAGARRKHVELDVPDFTTIASAKSIFASGGVPRFEKTLGNFGLVYGVVGVVL